MKNSRFKSALAGISFAVLLTGCDQSAIAEPQGQTEKDQTMTLDTAIEEASYLVGYQQAQGLSQQAAGAIDMQAYLQGAADFVAGGESQVSAAEQARLMQALQEAVSAKQMEASAGVRAAGDQYRAEFAAQEGVVELESGLLYEVITQGTGEKPTAGDTVSTHYHGTLIDGSVFDSSVERGQPATFPVNGVIAGWTEALQLMPVGSKWRLVLPPELAYGDRGAGQDIGPGATLTFEVELLEIQ